MSDEFATRSIPSDEDVLLTSDLRYALENDAVVRKCNARDHRLCAVIISQVLRARDELFVAAICW